MYSNEGPVAAIFDLDGVITFTAGLHSLVWKQLFDEYLREREQRFNEPFREFDIDSDYRKYVDGKPRYDGVADFLTSRRIHIPRGTPRDSPDADSVCGLGNRKNALFVERVQREGVDTDSDAVQFVRSLKDRGVRVGLASSSKNAVPVLQAAKIDRLFDAVVDGVVSEKLGLRGKPAPDIFSSCLDLIAHDLPPGRAMVFEDAVSGVEAGIAAQFGLVVGVDRGGRSDELLEHGADFVIRSFRDVSPDSIKSYFRYASRKGA